MRSENPPVIRLADYAPPAFLVDTVDLHFDLRPSATRVTTRLAMRPNPDQPGSRSLQLDGEGLKLIGLAIDGKSLVQTAYALTDAGLTIAAPPSGSFALTIETEISPDANTRLMGLYRSNGVYCTQCEADGFRRITFFPDRPDVMAVYRVTIDADAREAPILLSNGNLVESGSLPGARHRAVWHDPHPKPCYLFALVAGDLGKVSDRYKTLSDREVDLAIYVEKGKETRALYALDALKRSMAWDERVYGREYDLSVFNIVAVSDFNMGAMENKGLNIFNDRYILASADTATDQDYHNIEAIVAHEYFHNWTGNRITCRDWFQLCLKEGLTVFRDQEFSSDMRSRAVERIANVQTLRASQFVEDAGPLAHPVRPTEYREVNNFYTATVYNKGAEVIRMLRTLIGAEMFRAGMDRYFSQHDGRAATIEEFVSCFAEVSGHDLEPFMRWYSQAGTPTVRVSETFDEASETYRLTFEQTTPATPGQNEKKPFVIPITLGLVSDDGHVIDDAKPELFVLDSARATRIYGGIRRRPIPSLFREFSAPVKIDIDLSDRDLLLLAAHDTDPFNRHEALVRVAMAALRRLVADLRSGKGEQPDTALPTALSKVLGVSATDPAFAALALTPPSESDLAREIGTDVDPAAIGQAVDTLVAFVGEQLMPQALDCYRTLAVDPAFSPDAASAGRRSLRNRLLRLILAGDPAIGADLAKHQFEAATNMTDRVGAMAALARHDVPARQAVLSAFEAQFGNDALIMDTWFSVQATIPEGTTLDRVRGLLDHPRFTLANPNRIRALIGSFANGNPRVFHRGDGAGYAFVTELIAAIDPKNPQVAARLATAFRAWKTLEPSRRAKIEARLRDLADREGLSRDLRDILDRALS